MRQQPVQPHTLPPQPVCQCRILHLLGLGHQSTQITRAFVLNDPQTAVIGGTVAPQIRQQCTAAVRDHFDRVDRSVDVLLCGAGRLCIYAPEQYIPRAAAQERIQLLHRVQTGKLLCRVAAPLNTQRIAHCEQRRMPQLGAQQQLADCVTVQLRKKCVFHHYPPKTPCNFTFVLWESCCRSRSCFPASGICCAVFGILISVFADVKKQHGARCAFLIPKIGGLYKPNPHILYDVFIIPLPLLSLQRKLYKNTGQNDKKITNITPCGKLRI